ncbi:hypothetical protein TI04_01650 [Achromatium sp. WMS2]|nr:hypothetical protein TI04_01650 [Achromatium sp. WMS2]
MNPDYEEFIGFDLGHAETAVTLAKFGANTEPAPLEITGLTVIPTAVGVDDSGNIKLGEKALTLVAESKAKAYIAFKSQNLTDLKVREPIRLFAQGIIQHLVDGNKIQGGHRSLTLVGCPSGWSPNIRENYTKLLQSAGITNIKIIPESRAAFIQARESQEIRLSDTTLAGKVLIVDIGSSTTDFTAVINFREYPFDFGNVDLGAGLIDELILERQLEEQSNKVALKLAFSTKPIYRLGCLLKCRRAKEQYFTQQANGETEIQIDEIYKLPGTRELFSIELNTSFMDAILSQPLTKLGDRGWIDAYRECLLETKQRLEREQVTPELLLMTGGASRMRFTQDIAKEIFPQTQLAVGTQPQFAIAKGLAWAGRIDHKMTLFRAEVDNLAPTINTILRNAIDGIYEPVAEVLVNSINSITINSFNAWRECKIGTLLELEKSIERDIINFVRSDEFTNKISDIIQKWLMRSVMVEIDATTRPLCEQHKIPASSLSLLNSYNRISVGTDYRFSNATSMILNAIGAIVAIIGGIIMAMISGGAGVALISSGPIGLIIGFIIGVIGVAMGWDRVEGVVKSKVLPCITRKVLTEVRVQNKIAEQRPKLYMDIIENLRSANIGEQIITEASKGITANLHTAADSLIMVLR